MRRLIHVFVTGLIALAATARPAEAFDPRDIAGHTSAPPEAIAAERAPDERQRDPSAADEIRERTGLTFAVLESKIRRRIISTDTPYGFKIRRVAPDTPAARAGLTRGDVLLTLDGEPIRTLRGLRRQLRAAPDAAPLPISFARLKPHRTIFTRRPWEMHEGVIEPVGLQGGR